MSGVTKMGLADGGVSDELAPSGGSADGTATGTDTGAVSTTVGSLCAVGEPALEVAAGVTGAATRGDWSMTGGILGAFGRLGLACVAAGTWASFLGDTGRSAVAAPVGLGAALAARAILSSSDSAW